MSKWRGVRGRGSRGTEPVRSPTSAPVRAAGAGARWIGWRFAGDAPCGSEPSHRLRTLAGAVLMLVAAGCARPPVPLQPPREPLPWFAARLGEPCGADVEWGGGFERCADGRISLVVRTRAHYLITGQVPGEGCCTWGIPCRDPYLGASAEPSPPLRLPPRQLVHRTLSRSRGAVDEQSVHVDGALLWIVGIYEVSVNCRGGVIVVADRRLLSTADRELIYKLLTLDAKVDLDDDTELEAALRHLPSLPPGVY
jgi:hypothetical protein